MGVAGGVYFSFEYEIRGIGLLEQFMNLEGDSGVWAALNLVRRGRKDAMPHALQVFDSPAREQMPTYLNTLQSRLLVLLSNSCKTSGISMPDVTYGPGRRDEWPPVGSPLRGPFTQSVARQKTLAWWSEHQDRFTVHNPWFEILKEREIGDAHVIANQLRARHGRLNVVTSRTHAFTRR